jgi:hypothetical protein
MTEDHPSDAAAVSQEGKPAPSDWSRVSRLAPGTAVTVTATGARGQRYVIDAGDAGLTVLNLTDPTLSGSVIKVLRDVATHHPAWFQAARAGQSFQLEKGVRIGPDGLWVSGRTAADWSGIVTEITRRDVIEIRGPLPHSARRDALLGLAVGGALFGGVAAGMCAASGGTGPCAGEVAAAAAIGGGLMAGLGAGAGAAGNAFHPKQGVLYHGP